MMFQKRNYVIRKHIARMKKKYKSFEYTASAEYFLFITCLYVNFEIKLKINIYAKFGIDKILFLKW